MLEVVAEEQEEFLESLNRRRMKSRGLMEGGREIEVRGSDEVRRCSFAPPPQRQTSLHKFQPRLISQQPLLSRKISDV